MRYLTYDAGGGMTGAYIQQLLPEHAASYIEVGSDVYMQWVNYRMIDGELVFVAPPPAPPPPIPQSVSMRQARLALLGAGLLDAVDAAIAGMTGTEGRAAQIEWEYASEVVRTSALVAGMGAALGMTDEQLDDLFLQASTL